MGWIHLIPQIVPMAIYFLPGSKPFGHDLVSYISYHHMLPYVSTWGAPQKGFVTNTYAVQIVYSVNTVLFPSPPTQTCTNLP